MDAGSSEVTLSELLQKSLSSAQALVDSVPSSPEAQAELASTLGHLQLCARMIDRLSLLSPNETVEDLTGGALRCVLVPFWQAALVAQQRSPGTVLRQQHLNQSKKFYRQFQTIVDQYGIFDRSALPKHNAHDAGAKRMAKITAFKLEKELDAQIKAIQERRGQVTVNSTAESEADEHLRPLMLAQIRLSYLRALSELSSIEQELELLSHAIPTSELPAPDSAATRREKEEEDTTWRLDNAAASSSRSRSWFDPAAGPVLNTEGRVMRPFTITGSATTSTEGALSTRLALQDQVFGPGYRLPTMSVDEFLELEMARDNVLQGGEADAQRQEADSRRKKELVEMDNLEAYEESDRRLAEQRAGDEYRDTHRRGDGNRIGRG